MVGLNSDGPNYGRNGPERPSQGRLNKWRQGISLITKKIGLIVISRREASHKAYKYEAKTVL